jgi:hypothetical protein
MPLRDHFRPPVWRQASWEGFHGMWPVVMVQQLFPKLPDEYTAEPRVHLGTNFEIDVCAYERQEIEITTNRDSENGGLQSQRAQRPRRREWPRSNSSRSTPTKS